MTVSLHIHEFFKDKSLWFLQEAVVTARFSAISTGSMVNGVWYKPVEQFILPKVSFLYVLTTDPQQTDMSLTCLNYLDFFKVCYWLIVSSRLFYRAVPFNKYSVKTNKVNRMNCISYFCCKTRLGAHSDHCTKWKASQELIYLSTENKTLNAISKRSPWVA